MIYFLNKFFNSYLSHAASHMKYSTQKKSAQNYNNFLPSFFLEEIYAVFFSESSENIIKNIFSFVVNSSKNIYAQSQSFINSNYHFTIFFFQQWLANLKVQVNTVTRG